MCSCCCCCCSIVFVIAAIITSSAMSFQDLPNCILPSIPIFLQDHQVGRLSKASKSCSVLLHHVLVIRKAERLSNCILPILAMFLQDYQVGRLSGANNSCSVLLHDVLVVRKADLKYQQDREAEWLDYGNFGSYSDSDNELLMQDAAEQ
jgi:hypothetical protein